MFGPISVILSYAAIQKNSLTIMHTSQEAVETQVAEARDGVHHAEHGHDDPLAGTYGGDHGDAGIRGAIHNMDSQFLYLLSRVTGLSGFHNYL